MDPRMHDFDIRDPEEDEDPMPEGGCILIVIIILSLILSCQN